MTEPLFSLRVQRELRAAAEWIAADNPQAARVLVRTALRGFPYPMVYDADADPPHLVRFVHTARDLPTILTESGGLPE